MLTRERYEEMLCSELSTGTVDELVRATEFGRHLRRTPVAANRLAAAA